MQSGQEIFYHRRTTEAMYSSTRQSYLALQQTQASYRNRNPFFPSGIQWQQQQQQGAYINAPGSPSRQALLGTSTNTIWNPPSQTNSLITYAENEFVRLLNNAEVMQLRAYEYYYKATGRTELPTALTHNGIPISASKPDVAMGYRAFVKEQERQLAAIYGNRDLFIPPSSSMGSTSTASTQTRSEAGVSLLQSALETSKEDEPEPLKNRGPASGSPQTSISGKNHSEWGQQLDPNLELIDSPEPVYEYKSPAPALIPKRAAVELTTQMDTSDRKTQETRQHDNETTPDRKTQQSIILNETTPIGPVESSSEESNLSSLSLTTHASSTELIFSDTFLEESDDNENDSVEEDISEETRPRRQTRQSITKDECITGLKDELASSGVINTTCAGSPETYGGSSETLASPSSENENKGSSLVSSEYETTGIRSRPESPIISQPYNMPSALNDNASPGSARHTRPLNIIDPKTGQTVTLNDGGDCLDSAGNKTFRVVDLNSSNASTVVLSPNKRASGTISVGNERAEVLTGMPPSMQVNEVALARPGFAEYTGRFVFVLDRPTTDKRLAKLSEFYLGRNTDHLKVKEIVPTLMVMIVNRNAGTVTRARVLGDNPNSDAILCYCVDEGRVSITTPTDLMVTTTRASQLKWKNFICELDGLSFFHDTKFFNDAYLKVESQLENQIIQLTCVGKNKENIAIVQADIVNPANSKLRSFNDIFLDAISEAYQFPFPTGEDTKGSTIRCHVGAVGENGELYLQTEAGYSEVIKMNDYLGEVKYSDVCDTLPPVTAENVSFGEMYIGVYDEDGFLYRVQILSLVKDTESEKMLAKALFIDYGNIEIMPFDSIRRAIHVNRFLLKIKPLCCKTYLKWIKHVLDPKGLTALLQEPDDAAWDVHIRNDIRDGLPVVCIMDNGKPWNQAIIRQGLAAKEKPAKTK